MAASTTEKKNKIAVCQDDLYNKYLRDSTSSAIGHLQHFCKISHMSVGSRFLIIHSLHAVQFNSLKQQCRDHIKSD